MLFPGQKRRQLFLELILPQLPVDLQNYVYVEPFGGTFAVNSFLTDRPKRSIYNDLKHYDIEIVADVIEHIDYQDIFIKYDSVETIFYIDPPYYNKEQLYGLPNKYVQFHVDLRNQLMFLKGKYVLSYEKCPFIVDLYTSAEFKIINYSGKNGKFRNELVIIPTKI